MNWKRSNEQKNSNFRCAICHFSQKKSTLTFLDLGIVQTNEIRKGPSIDDVAHFTKQAYMEQHHFLADPKWVTSFIDGPLGRILQCRKKMHY